MSSARQFFPISSGLTCLALTLLMLGACNKAEPEAVKIETDKPVAATETEVTSEDPFLWMEDVLGEQSLEWVREENARTLDVL